MKGKLKVREVNYRNIGKHNLKIGEIVRLQEYGHMLYSGIKEGDYVFLGRTPLNEITCLSIDYLGNKLDIRLSNEDKRYNKRNSLLKKVGL